MEAASNDKSAGAREAAELVRRHVLSCSARLPATPAARARGLADLLLGREWSEWWALRVTEKTPFSGQLIPRLYDVARREVRARAEGRSGAAPAHESRHRWLPWAFTYWRHALVAAGRAAVMCALSRRMPWRSRPPVRRYIFTVYPLWWNDRPRASGDRFFSDVDGRRFAFVAWLHGTRALWRAQRRASSGPAVEMAPLQRWLKPADVLEVLSLRRFALAARVARQARANVRADLDAADVSGIWADEIAASFAASEYFVALLIRRAVSRWSAGARPEILLYRVEWQPWEHGLLSAVGQASPETVRVGFCHSPFGPNYLPLRFAAGEVQEALEARSDPLQRPMPDAIITCGARLETMLVSDGFGSLPISHCGPQRHRQLLDFLAAPVAREEIRRGLGLRPQDAAVLIGLGVVQDETHALFAALEHALRELPRVRCFVRTHPNRPLGDAAMAAAIAASHGRVAVLPPEAGLYAAMSACDAMVTIGSTVVFEAMALGCMPIVFDAVQTFPATSLSHFEESLYVVDSGPAVARALAETTTGSPVAAAKRSTWPNAVREVFGDLDTPLPAQLESALSAT